MTDRVIASQYRRVFCMTDSYRGGGLAEYVAIEARALAPLPGDVDFEPADAGSDRMAGTAGGPQASSEPVEYR